MDGRTDSLQGPHVHVVALVVEVGVLLLLAMEAGIRMDGP